MRPSRPLFLLLALLAACSEPPPVTPAGADASVPREEACADKQDDDQDGKTDCDDSDCSQYVDCKPPIPTSCGLQRDCGDVVKNITAKVCLDGKCVAPGEHTFKGEPVLAEVVLDLLVTNAATKPKTAVVRFIYPYRLDGSVLSCADLLAIGNCKDTSTRGRLDAKGELNQVFRNVYALTFSSGATFSVPEEVPKGADYILYGETWYGPRDSADINQPTGLCAATFCVEGQSVTTSGTHYRLSFP